MSSQSCLLCLEDLLPIDKVSHPLNCKCNVYLHIDCLKQIRNNGLLCPICRIKESPENDRISNFDDSYLLFYANKVFTYFAENPNMFRIILYVLTCFIITFYLILHFMWLGLKNQNYRLNTLILISLVLLMIVYMIFINIVIYSFIYL
jgi:hypothetical protein